jgi:hypothetical protein
MTFLGIVASVIFVSVLNYFANNEIGLRVGISIDDSGVKPVAAIPIGGEWKNLQEQKSEYTEDHTSASGVKPHVAISMEEQKNDFVLDRNEIVVKSERVRRPNTSAPKGIGSDLYYHYGLRLTTNTGNKILIHNVPNDGVVAGTSKIMSRNWTVVDTYEVDSKRGVTVQNVINAMSSSENMYEAGKTKSWLKAGLCTGAVERGERVIKGDCDKDGNCGKFGDSIRPELNRRQEQCKLLITG